MKIPIAKCKAPPKERLLRKVDEIFVSSLKEQLKSDPIGPGVPPVALLCTDVVCCEEFSLRLTPQYSYEVLGGLHSITAKRQLLEEYPGITRQVIIIDINLNIKKHIFVCIHLL